MYTILVICIYIPNGFCGGIYHYPDTYAVVYAFFTVVIMLMHCFIMKGEFQGHLK